MSRSVNRVILLGNVGRDPEVRTTSNGTRVATFSLATARKYKKGDGYVEDTAWHRLTLWDRLAELAEEYVRKGDRLYVEGRIDYSTTDADDGSKRYWTDIVVSELVLLGSGKSDDGSPF